MAAGSADGLVIFDCPGSNKTLQGQHNNVSPPVIGGVAAASADGVVLFLSTMLWKNLSLLNYHPASAKPPAPLLDKEGSFVRVTVRQVDTVRPASQSLSALSRGIHSLRPSHRRPRLPPVAEPSQRQ